MKLFPYILVFALSACTRVGDHHDEHEHGHDEHEHGHDENMVELTSDQMALMGIKINNPERINLRDVVKSNGKLEVPPGKRAIVGSITNGRITEIRVMQGDEVKKGQVLAIIEHPDIVEMQEQYLVSKSRLAFAQSQYDRHEGLFETGAISKVEFQEIESNLNAEKAIYNAFLIKFRMLNIDVNRVEQGNLYSGVTIRSPLSGFIHQIMVQLGAFVTAETPLFNIVDIDHIHMDLSVYERDIHKVKQGDMVAFNLVDQPEKIYKGQIFAVGRSFEEEPRILTVHAEIANKDRNLLPGMYIDARIITDTSTSLSVPNDGLIAESDHWYVFLVRSKIDDTYKFERVEVITGTSDMGFTAITGRNEMIKPNDYVVISGAYYLASELGKGELEHHH